MSCIHTSGPDQALIKSGIGLSQPKIVPGGFVFKIPFCQQVQRLSLAVMTLEIVSPVVYTLQGVPLSVSSIAQVKIARHNEGLKKAAGQFLDMSISSIEHTAQQTLEGHQRAIMGTMTVEEIYSDRKKFAIGVLEHAGLDLGNLGLEIVSYTIKDIQDDEGYLESLGKTRTAEVKRDARIGEAEAERDAVIKEAEARKVMLAAKYQADTEIADAKRRFELQEASFNQLINAKNAEASLAFELQSNKTRQLIKKEEMEISIIERKKQIEIEHEEVERRQKELEATVRKPAEAEKYRLEILAEANRQRVVKEAEAKANSTQLVGEAQAEIIKAKGIAEASRMKSKAVAWKEYSDGAYMEMIIQRLPEIATEICKPLENIGSITMVNTGTKVGFSNKLSNEVMETMAQLPPILKNMSGVDLQQALKKLTT